MFNLIYHIISKFIPCYFRQIDRQIDGWMDGQTDGWMNGWMDRWMGEQIWSSKEYSHYSVMMLYHSIKNSKEESMSKNIVKGQRKYNIEETFYKRVNSVSNETEKMRKSSWKKLINQKIK